MYSWLFISVSFRGGKSKPFSTYTVAKITPFTEKEVEVIRKNFLIKLFLTISQDEIKTLPLPDTIKKDMKKSSLYTRTGDDGTTSLVGGSREQKTSARIEAYGTVDELNSWIGLVASQDTLPADDRSLLYWIQMRLFDIGSYLACPAPADGEQPLLGPGVDDDAIERLEHAIDRLDSATPKANLFVLPGGCQASAMTQVARTVARRAERRILSLHATEPVDAAARRFVNRLSDYLFILGRNINALTSTPETYWKRSGR